MKDKLPKVIINYINEYNNYTLKHFNIDAQDMTNCQAGLIGINYSDSYVKELIDEWYK